MGFVPLRGTRAGGAFGHLNRPTKQVADDLRKAFGKAKAECFKLAEPTTRRFPLERLRRRISNILAIDVIYQPRLVKVDLVDKPSQFVWDASPVWRTAPCGAYRKAAKLSNLLHTVAVCGWRANLTHDLVRLATNVWHMPMWHFDGLCRRILARVYRSVRPIPNLKSPDPVLRFVTLSTNPICNPYSVYRFQDRRDRLKGLLGVNHLPKGIALSAMLRNRARRAYTLSVDSG
jgi:hypothetical protein